MRKPRSATQQADGGNTKARNPEIPKARKLESSKASLRFLITEPAVARNPSVARNQETGKTGNPETS